MQISYDRNTIQTLTEGLSGLNSWLIRDFDEVKNSFEACMQQYSRLSGKLEEIVRKCQNRVSDARRQQQQAQKQLNQARQEQQNARNTQDSNKQQAANAKVQAAQQAAAAAARKAEEAEKKLQEAQEKLRQLQKVWEEKGIFAQNQMCRASETMGNICGTCNNADRDLGTFSSLMEKARSVLYGTNTAPADGGASAAAGTSGGASASAGTPGGSAAFHGTISGAPGGSVRANGGYSGGSGGYSAVSVGPSGEKQLALSIGGVNRSYPCSADGAAQAYNDAFNSGDQEMIVRTSAIFDIETMRSDLELTAGDPAYAQFGGYHRNVTAEEPTGYESHHIPSRSVQAENADLLPAIAITKEDHQLTSSYSGRQRSRYSSFIPGGDSPLTYKESMEQKLAEGGSGYVQAVRDELYDLRVTTGHRYDGGIAAFLDAVVDMIASRGIPRSAG